MIAPEYKAPPIAKCPFCRDTATTCMRDDDRGHYVLCLSCEASGPASWSVTSNHLSDYMDLCNPQCEDDRRDVAAIFAWNTTARVMKAGLNSLLPDSAGAEKFWKDQYFKQVEESQEQQRALRTEVQTCRRLIDQCEKVLIRGPRAHNFELDRDVALETLQAYWEGK